MHHTSRAAPTPLLLSCTANGDAEVPFALPPLLLHTHVRVMRHSYVWHDSFICVTWPTHMCDMTRSYVCAMTYLYVTWLIHMGHNTFIHDEQGKKKSAPVALPPLLLHTVMMHICDMTYSYVTWLNHMWHDLFMCDMTHRVTPKCRTLSCCTELWRNYMRHCLFMCDLTDSYVAWLIHMWHDWFICDMTDSYVTWLIHLWHDYDSFICNVTSSYVMRLIHMWHDWFICDMTDPYVTWLIHMWHDSFIYYITCSYVTRRTGWHRSAVCTPAIDATHRHDAYICDITYS